jgi:hypothetical protein
MTVVDHAARIARLAVVLRLRDAAIDPVIAAVASTPPTDRLLVGASAHGSRLELVMPFYLAAFEKLAPGAVAIKGADRLWLRIDGDTIEVGTSSEREVDVADVVPAWHAILEQMCSICGGRVASRGRWIRTEHDFAFVHYPTRDRAKDQMLMLGLDQLAEDVGVSAPQRKLWQRLHPQTGNGDEISVTTGAVNGQLSNQFAVTYRNISWEQALRLGEGLVLKASEAEQVPAELGQFAGALDADRPHSLELRLGPHEPPDVVVWGQLAPHI